MVASILARLKPAPRGELVTDPRVVDATYRKWRARTLWGCFAGYVVFYLCRRNIPLALPGIAAELGRSKAALGMIESAGHAAYGIGKFANGVLADRSNPRYFMALGLLLTALANVAFASASSLPILVLVWGLNGWFQSMGFPPGARLLSHWFAPRRIFPRRTSEILPVCIWADGSYSLGATNCSCLQRHFLGRLTPSAARISFWRGSGFGKRVSLVFSSI